MRRIRDATGATDVGEVVQRFLTQGETQEHLRALQRENTEKLSNLREVSKRAGSSFCGAPPRPPYPAPCFSSRHMLTEALHFRPPTRTTHGF